MMFDCCWCGGVRYITVDPHTRTISLIVRWRIHVNCTFLMAAWKPKLWLVSFGASEEPLEAFWGPQTPRWDTLNTWYQKRGRRERRSSPFSPLSLCTYCRIPSFVIPPLLPASPPPPVLPSARSECRPRIISPQRNLSAGCHLIFFSPRPKRSPSLEIRAVMVMPFLVRSVCCLISFNFISISLILF